MLLFGFLRWCRHMPRRIGVATLGVVTVATSTAGASAGGGSWRLLETPDCTVISQLGERPTLAWAEEFNQFTAELRRVFRAERPHLPPLTVVMFARDRDFQPYKPRRSHGRLPAPTDGYFHHRGNWSVIGLAERYDEQATRELIFHEGVHWFTSNDPVIYPVWLSEGLAEVFSTFRQEEGYVRWGTDIPAHVRLLRTEEMIPLSRLLFIGRDDPLFDQRHRTGMFYAQSWAFVHYLMFGERDGPRDAISDYLALLGTELHPDAAFRRAFGQDYPEMNGTLATYIRDGRYYKVSRPDAPAARITAATTIAPPAVVEIALARLAIAVDWPDQARPHAERAVALDPALPGGHELLALLCDQAGDVRGARAACERAVALGSQDATTLFLLAYLTAKAEMAAGGLGSSTAREVADLYGRAITHSPTLVQAYQNLAALAPSLQSGTDQDLALLRQGARMYRNRGDIVLGLAHLVAQRGDRTTARQLIAEARQRGLPVEADRQARRLEEHWVYEEAAARIEALTKSGDEAGALAVCEEAMARVTDIHVRGSLVHIRHGLAGRISLAAADKAARRGAWAEARERYQALLSDPTTPPAIRRQVEEALQRISGR